MRWDQKFKDGFVDLMMETENDDIISKNLGSEKVRAITRMLLFPSKSVRRRLLFESLVLPHHDRIN